MATMNISIELTVRNYDENNYFESAHFVTALPKWKAVMRLTSYRIYAKREKRFRNHVLTTDGQLRSTLKHPMILLRRGFCRRVTDERSNAI